MPPIILKIIYGYSLFVTGASYLHTLLPPWEFLADYPRAQKAYKAGIYFIGWVAVNQRSTAHPSISTANGTQTSDAANSVGSPKP